MSEDWRSKPVSRSVATEDSLDLSEALASALRLEFDRDKVRRLSRDLHQIYFDEITAALEIGPTGLDLQLQAGTFYFVNAFAAPRGLEGIDIGFDEYLDFWLATMANLATVAACVDLDDADYGRLLDDVERALEMLREPFLFHRVRPRMRYWIERFPDCIQLGHLISRAMIVYVLCHELGHAVLGHVRDKPSREAEIAADAWAAHAFDRLLGISASSDWRLVSHVRIDWKLASAPMLFMRFLELAQCKGKVTSADYHPRPVDRRAALDTVLAPRIVDRAEYLYSGFSRALEEVASNLDRLRARMGEDASAP